MKLKRPKAARLSFAEIKTGSVYFFDAKVTQRDVRHFARLTGDFNPLHLDARFARQKNFSKNVVHGMLLAGLFSRLAGMLCPGRDCLYLSQTLEFRKPVFPGQTVRVQGTVSAKSDNTKIVTLQTEIIVSGQKAVTGETKARFLSEGNHE